jgi:PrtD family type I secretion system ABC transporter
MTFLNVTLPDSMMEAVRACRSHILKAAFFSALINILYLAPTIYMMQVYDRVVPTGGIVTLIGITLIVAIAIGTLAALESVRMRLMVRASLRLDRLLAGDILNRLLARTGRSDAASAQAMRDFDTVRQTFASPAMTALFDAPWTPLYLLVAFMIHPVLGLLVLVAGAAIVAVAFANERWTKANGSEANKAIGRSYVQQEAVIARAEVVRSLGMSEALIARQLRDRQAGMSLLAVVQFAGGRYTSLAKFLRLFLQSFALGVGAWLAVERQISVGAIIAASVLLSRALQPIELAVSSWRQIGQARDAIANLKELFEQTAVLDLERTPLPAPDGRLDLENIVLRTPDQEGVILRNVSFSVEPGEMVGIIGPSGAGKTALARVIAGGLSPDHGTLRIDGSDYRDWDAGRLAGHIGYLPQEATLFGGTIAENISRFAVAGGTDPYQVATKVLEAASSAGVHEMIQKLSGGYDSPLDHAGRGLSAGQAQRIALARALYGDPALLILDEPNSALDSEGEAALASAITAAKKRGASVIVIAHRLGVLNEADRLVVMREGMVDCIGPSAEILAHLNGRVPASNVVAMKGA